MSRYVWVLLMCVGCAHDSFDEIHDLDGEPSSMFDVGGTGDAQVVTDSGRQDRGNGANPTDQGGVDPSDDGVPNLDAQLNLDASVEDPDADGEPIDSAIVSVDAETVERDSAVEPMDASVIEPDAMVEPPVGYSLCGAGLATRVGSGTWEEPIQIGRFPFLDRFTTATEGQSRVDTYDCAPTTGEFGREVVYEFELDVPGDFLAEVVDDGSGVDIDLHLLRDYSVSERTVEGCVGRAHLRLVQERLEPGRYLLVADSWSNPDGVSFEGAYDLAIDVIEHRVWRDIPLTEDILWSRYRGLVDGSWQSINTLRLSPPAIERMQAGAHDGCKTVESQVAARTALAGVNAGYFDAQFGCRDEGFLRINDESLSFTVATESDPPLPTEARVGWRGSQVSFTWAERGSDWTEPSHAFGSHPMLVTNGVPQAQVQSGEQVYSAVDWGAQPRTALALTTEGDVLLMTIDGRTSAGAGMSTPALADWIGSTYDVSGAINFDGGGSTSFVINQCWVGSQYGTWGARAFNSPSDNGEADENGARGVSSGVYVY